MSAFRWIVTLFGRRSQLTQTQHGTPTDCRRLRLHSAREPEVSNLMTQRRAPGRTESLQRIEITDEAMEQHRWLLNRAHKNGEEKRYEEAFNSLVRLRPTRLQAARDLFLIHHELLELDKVAETDRTEKSQRPFMTLFTDGRSARALLASVTCMFFQQVSRFRQQHILQLCEFAM